MRKRFLKGLKLHTQTPTFLAITVTAGFLFGFAFNVVFMLLSEDEWFPMGSVGAMAGMIGFLVITYLNYPGEFMLSISMGQTRKEFLVCHALERLLWITLTYGWVLLLTWLERALCRLVITEATELFDLLPILTDFRVILTAVPVLALMEMFFGALYACFGKPVNVVIYILWMAIAMSTTKWIHLIPKLVQLPAALWITLSLAVSAAMVLTVVILGRKQGVR